MAHAATARAKIPTENPQTPRPAATLPPREDAVGPDVTPPRQAERNPTRGYTQVAVVWWWSWSGGDGVPGAARGGPLAGGVVRGRAGGASARRWPRTSSRPSWLR
jgi:hypothetical protein